MKSVLNRLKNSILCVGCKHLEKGKGDYPDAKMLSERHLKNCKVLENRDRLLYFLPKNAVCAEIGIETGKTSARILEVTLPRRLHLIEIQDKWVDNARQMFSEEIKQEKVLVHNGSSFDELSKFDDNYFDWVFIDGEHLYDGVKRDLEAAMRKTKDDGFIWLHDYIYYDHIAGRKFGVVEAVNEACVNHNYEMVFYTLHQQMFNSVVLKKIMD